jgi:hypothetical protein
MIWSQVKQWIASRNVKVMPWLGQLATGLSLGRPRFVPGSVHVAFVVDKVAMGQIFL